MRWCLDRMGTGFNGLFKTCDKKGAEINISTEELKDIEETGKCIFDILIVFLQVIEFQLTLEIGLDSRSDTGG